MRRYTLRGKLGFVKQGLRSWSSFQWVLSDMKSCQGLETLLAEQCKMSPLAPHPYWLFQSAVPKILEKLGYTKKFQKFRESLTLAYLRPTVTSRYRYRGLGI